MKSEEFVKAWLQAVKENRNQSWLAEKLGLSRQSVSAKAYYYRKRGVDLPLMPKGSRKNRIDVEKLNKLIHGDK